MPSWAACLRPLSQTLFINYSILSRYLVVTIKNYIVTLITIMLSVTVFVNDFILTFRREKKLGSSNHKLTCA